MNRGRVIPIKNDKGWDLCQSCEYFDSDTCAFCDFGDQYEEADQDSARLHSRELLAA